MPGTLTTFANNVITQTPTLSSSLVDAHVTTVVSKVANVTNINGPEFLANQAPNFYASPLYQQWIVNNSPPANTSYGKDPGDASDDSYDPNLNFANYVTLPSGAEQHVLTGDQSIMYASDLTLTVDGNKQTGYDGSISQTAYSLLNRKIYNGALTICNGSTVQFFNALVTTYEHQNVSVQSNRNDTVLHFGDETILRKGNEIDQIVGQTFDTTFGDVETRNYGNKFEVTTGTATVNKDFVVDLSSVTGTRLAVNAGLATNLYLGAFVAMSAFSIVIAVKEQLAGILEGRYEGMVLETALNKLEKVKVAGTAMAFCLRGIALVFGVKRA